MFDIESRSIRKLLLAGLAAAAATIAVAQTPVAGSLVLPPELRWGIDVFHYRNSGSCTGATVDFSNNPIAIDVYSEQAYFGQGVHPVTVPCVGGSFQVDSMEFPQFSGQFA